MTETVDAIGHRVVHGGDQFVEPTRITPEVLFEIKELTVLAHLHIPANVAGIEACITQYPESFKWRCLIRLFTVLCQDVQSTMPLIERQRKSMAYVDLVFMDCLIDGRPIRWQKQDGRTT